MKKQIVVLLGAILLLIGWNVLAQQVSIPYAGSMTTPYTGTVPVTVTVTNIPRGCTQGLALLGSPGPPPNIVVPLNCGTPTANYTFCSPGNYSVGPVAASSGTISLGATSKCLTPIIGITADSLAAGLTVTGDDKSDTWIKDSPTPPAGALSDAQIWHCKTPCATGIGKINFTASAGNVSMVFLDETATGGQNGVDVAPTPVINNSISGTTYTGPNVQPTQPLDLIITVTNLSHTSTGLSAPFTFISNPYGTGFGFFNGAPSGTTQNGTWTVNPAGGNMVVATVAYTNTPKFTSITVGPPNTSVQVGATQQFKATDNLGNDITSSSTWSSSNTAIATINGSGLATGVAVGQVTITALKQSITGTATLTVTQQSGNQSLLPGATVDSHNNPSVPIPSGWTLRAAQGFDAGPLPPGQSTDTTFNCNFAHTGGCSLSGNYNNSGAAVRWIYNDNQLPGRTFYLSYWDYGQGELFNEEYVLMHPIKHNTGGPAGFEEFGTTLKFWDAGVLIYNEPTPEITCCGGQGDFTNVEQDGPRFTNYGQTGWNQWEFWVHANTPNQSDGFQRVYRNGVLVWDIEGGVFNGPVDMTGMQVEAGGWYTKSVWTNNGQYPPNGTCSSAPGIGTEAGQWQGTFANLSGNCPPAPPIITRYIDDVILMSQ